MSLKSLFFILAVAMLWLTAACSRHSESWATLDRADAVMEEHPDSALALLQAIDSSTLNGDEEKARYALLLSQALDKNYIDTTTFDILQPAIDYYLEKGSPDEKLKTYYYKGVIYLNRGENDKALDSFIRGVNISQEVNDSLTLARNFVAQGYVYHNYYDFKSYIDRYTKAARIYKGLDLKDREFDCLLNILNGSVLLENKILSDSIINICDNFDHLSAEQKQNLALYKLSHAIKFGNADEIKALFEDIDIGNVSSYEMLSLAHAYNRLNNNTKAKNLLDSLKRHNIVSDPFKFFAVSVHVYEDMHDYEEALKNYKKFVRLHDSIDLYRFDRGIRTVEEKFKIEFEAQREAEHKSRIIWGCVCGIAILFMGILILLQLFRSNRIAKNLAIQKAKAEKLENDRLVSDKEKMYVENENLRLARDKKILEAENLNHRINILERESERLKNLIEEQKELPTEVYNTIRVRIEMLNTLIASHITANDRFEKSYDAWVKDYTKDIEQFMNSNRLAFQFSHPRFIQYFEEHGLTVEEINYVCLYTMGLSGIEIGEYIKKGGHVNMSSAIRKKLGLGRHDTNIGKYVQGLFKKL